MDTIFIYKCLWFWRAFFMCKMKTRSRLAGDFRSFGSRVLHTKFWVPLFPQPMHSHLFPVFPSVLICFYFRLSSWISTWPQESCWEQRAGGEATEAGGGWGGSSATPVPCCRLGPTWTGDANALRNRQGTGTSRTWEWFYFHLAKVPCSLSLPPSFTMLWWSKWEKNTCAFWLSKLLSPPVGEIWSLVIP